MQKHDFFTRMILMNAAGPNVIAPAADVEPVFVCGLCDAAHEDEDGARECCLPKVYERYRCPACSAVHREESYAKECCPGAGGQPMQCPVCMQEADSFSDAADCCLHTHPTMTAHGRWRAAELVEGGMPWAEAVAANEFH